MSSLKIRYSRDWSIPWRASDFPESKSVLVARFGERLTFVGSLSAMGLSILLFAMTFINCFVGRFVGLATLVIRLGFPRRIEDCLSSKCAQRPSLWTHHPHTSCIYRAHMCCITWPCWRKRQECDSRTPLSWVARRNVYNLQRRNPQSQVAHSTLRSGSRALPTRNSWSRSRSES